MTMVMDRTPSNCSSEPKTQRNWLRSALAGWFGRDAGRPTRLELDQASAHLLKDIGLSHDRTGGFDPRADRSGMNWPMR